MTTILNQFADDVPVNANELAKAMRVSRWTVYRWQDLGYKFELEAENYSRPSKGVAKIAEQFRSDGQG